MTSQQSQEDKIMMKNIHDIKEVEGKEVFLIRIKNSIGNDWICAYARLPNFSDEEYNTPSTFEKGDVVGVDTAHSWNKGMSIQEKEDDALKQIAKVIKHWRTY